MVEEEKEEEAVEPVAEEKAAEAKPREEEREVVEERVYKIPFRKVWIAPRGKRATRAVHMLQSFLKRHMKTEDIVLSNEINEKIWSRSIGKPSRSLRIRAVKDKEGKVIVYPLEGD